MEQAASQLKPTAESTRLSWRGTGTAWTAEEITKVIKLFNDGFSMGMIAEDTGRSRGSISGKIDRARKAGLLRPAVEKTTAQSRNVFQSHKNLRANTGLIAKGLMPRPVRLIVVAKKERVRLRLIESDTAVTFAELEFHHCKWPLGDPKRSDFRFCGCRRLTDKPYCETHTTLADRSSQYK